MAIDASSGAAAPQQRPARSLVNLKRLLCRCEDADVAATLHDPTERRRLATFVSVMERLWQDLRRSIDLGDAPGCSEEEVAEYWRRIEGVADLLDDAKLRSSSAGALANTRAHGNAKLSRAQACSAPSIAVAARPPTLPRRICRLTRS
jgi:hypothetical protein